MINFKARPRSIDDYIIVFPKRTQEMLCRLREVIKKAAPDAKESINYNIPTFKLEGNLVHFGGYVNHIGFYPGSSAIIAFAKELTAYECAKGSVKFLLENPLPFELIRRMVKFRVEENLKKAKTKKKLSSL